MSNPATLATLVKQDTERTHTKQQQQKQHRTQTKMMSKTDPVKNMG